MLYHNCMGMAIYTKRDYGLQCMDQMSLSQDITIAY
jgi:hypothetical protein